MLNELLIPPAPQPSLQEMCTKGHMELIRQAQKQNASDIHLQPKPDAFAILFRIQGTLLEIGKLPSDQGKTLLQSLKAHGKMNIAESRMPQDARLQDGTLNCRLATHPSIYGEVMVIRLLPFSKPKKLCELGFSAISEKRLLGMLEPTSGLTLACGATGSGKTTTLHGLLEELGDQAGHVVTLEDPVEIINPRAIQTDLSGNTQLNFSNGLRSLMRQDPDTILVGEIRDIETAQLTIQAALTGHRVLASLHAGGTLAALCRLQEFQVSLSSLLSCLNGIISQHLVRTPQGRKPLVESWVPKPSNRATLLQCQNIKEIAQFAFQADQFRAWQEDLDV